MWPTRGLVVRNVPFLVFVLSAAQVVTYVTLPALDLAMPMVRSPLSVWRSVTAMMAHVDVAHLANNLVAQLLLGAFVETLHGHWRFLLVYLVSGVGGALLYRARWCLYYAPTPVRLLGASGAVYGLMGAFGSHLLLNWAEVPTRWVWLAVACAVLCADLVIYAYDPLPRVAYSAHVGGALYGLGIGLVVLRNVRPLRHEAALQSAAATLLLLLTVASVMVCS